MNRKKKESFCEAKRRRVMLPNIEKHQSSLDKLKNGLYRNW